jgi:hypothetical protein
VADTFRRDHLGAYGNPFISTPHLQTISKGIDDADADTTAGYRLP